MRWSNVRLAINWTQQGGQLDNVLRKKRGRPATGQDPVTAIRLSEDMQAVDAWAARQADKPTRSEAMRRLVQLGLTVGHPIKPYFCAEYLTKADPSSKREFPSSSCTLCPITQQSPT